MKKQELKNLKLSLRKKTVSNLDYLKGGITKTRNGGHGTCYKSCVNWTNNNTCKCVA
ncbi:hypothetical protein [Kordia sp.]|uniref:hypothetical protein n=1 Tax=Kordia sp. TaxID=1965332 RepID=UPI003D6A4C90